MNKTIKILKLILIPLLLLCLLDMPYGYYMFVRLVAFGVFSLTAYYEYEKGSISLALIFAVAAVTFQPIIKIPLGRTLWNIADISLAICLIITFFKTKEK